MISELINMMNDVSFKKKTGRMVSDKSYAYDTIFFIGNYIKNNLYIDGDRKYFIRNKAQLENVKKYTQTIFKLDSSKDGAQNYFSETMNLFLFSNLFSEKTIDKNTKIFFLNNEEIFNWITSGFENSYIFLYVLVYQTMKNDNILSTYKSFLDNQNEHTLGKLYEGISSISISISRTSTQWSKQIVKYCVLILGFLNDGKVITRGLKIKEHIIGITDISINIPGSRTKQEFIKKNNGYFKTFSEEYILNTVKIKLLIKPKRYSDAVISDSNVYSDLASNVDKNIKLTEEIVELIETLEEEEFSRLIQRPTPSVIISGVKKKYPESLNRIKKEIGDFGEELVLQFEKEKLKETSYEPIRVSNFDDSLGYDIKSYDLSGNELHIEVKTQSRGKFESGEFYISANEKNKLDTNPNYMIYFIYDIKNKKAKFIKITANDLASFSFEASVYKIRFKAER